MLDVGVFPKRIVSMIGVGEKAGGVDEMLAKLAEYYEQDISAQTNVLTVVVYFVVYMAVAVTVGIVVIGAWSHYFGMIGDMINQM